MLDTYAQKYGMKPADVEQEPFNEVMPYVWLWKEQDEFNARLNAAKELFNSNNQPKP